jgi:ABC-type lipoprotein release transport system permease subunit
VRDRYKLETILDSDWVDIYREVSQMLRLKKIILILITVIVLIIASSMAHNVYAGKPIISLNSPVSFPVDI